MNLNELREIKARLEQVIDYSPPDNAPDIQWERAINRAAQAQEQLDDLAPVFALLNAMDDLAARVNRLEIGYEDEQETLAAEAEEAAYLARFEGLDSPEGKRYLEGRESERDGGFGNHRLFGEHEAEHAKQTCQKRLDRPHPV